MLTHVTQLKQRGEKLSDELEKAEASGPKLINIDVIDLTLQLEPHERAGATFFPTFESNKVVVVDPNSPAFKAGLRAGDLILAVDGVECTEGMIAPKLWKDGAGRPIRKLRIAPREVKVKQSPEHFLNECKKKLRSKRICFTSGGDRKRVVQLLLDFEDSIAVHVDQKRAKLHKFRTEDLVRARTKELGEARRSRDRELLQRLTYHEEPMPTLHVSEPTHTMHAVPKPTDAPKAPNPEPAPVRDLREHLDGIVATFFTTLFASKAGPPPPDPTGGKLAPETPFEGASACAHPRSMKDTSPHVANTSLAKLSDKFEA